MQWVRFLCEILHTNTGFRLLERFVVLVMGFSRSGLRIRQQFPPGPLA